MKAEQELIKKRLGKLGLGPRREEEIIRELSEHLADHAAALETRGLSRDSAAREALESVSNWPKFREEICRAETEEVTMNYQVTYRTRVLWLPGLVALTLSSILLAVFQFFGLAPRFYWVSETGYIFFTFYLPWLIALPLIGAVAAYWSQRAGGKAIHRLLAALAPPIGMLGFFLIGPFIALFLYILMALFGKGAAHTRALHALHTNHPPLIGVIAILVSWVLLPAVGLLIGAVPFLGKHPAQS
ncbi:MAG: permease prefix domain 1-containing protein [Acidobacteriota bacterium]|nr:permease prefix domain 1-containing protein [Acidobacteriota bacterium]